MKTFEQFYNIDEKEKLFLEVAHLDELVIKFDFIEYKNYIYYFYNNNICLFYQDKKSMYFYIHYDKIWSIFEKKFNLNYQEIKDFMNGVVEKHFKLNGYTTGYYLRMGRFRVDKHFKLNEYTTSIYFSC